MTETTTRSPRTKTPARWLAVSAVVVVVMAICAALGLLAYDYFRTYGPTADESFFAPDVLFLVGSTALPFVIPATIVMALAAALGVRLVRPPDRRIRFLGLLGLSLLVTTGSAYAGAGLGTLSKQRGQDRAAVACSPEETADLAALGLATQNGEYGIGRDDGSCQGYTAFGADGAAGLAGLRARMAAEGWVPNGGLEGPRTTYVRDGRTLVVTVVEDKATEVTLSFP